MSRLPVPTTGKRPTSSIGGLSFHSHIPMTARKSANLFTPKDKKTTSYYGASSAKKPLTTDRKFQRPAKPAPDRDEQQMMFENLVQFLAANSYPFPLPEARRFFSSVSSTEAARIFEFLFKAFVPSIKVVKMEDDIPKHLTLLGYPYIKSVTKSSLVSIATRQAAVNLLVIYNWLVKAANARLVRLHVSDSPRNMESDGNFNLELLKLVPLNREDQQEASREILKMRLGNAEDQLPSHREKVNNLLGEVELKREELSRKKEIAMEKKVLREDIEKYIKYSDEMTNYVSLMETKHQEVFQCDEEIEIAYEQLEEKEIAVFSSLLPKSLPKNLDGDPSLEEIENLPSIKEKQKAILPLTNKYATLNKPLMIEQDEALSLKELKCKERLKQSSVEREKLETEVLKERDADEEEVRIFKHKTEEITKRSENLQQDPNVVQEAEMVKWLLKKEENDKEKISQIDIRFKAETEITNSMEELATIRFRNRNTEFAANRDSRMQELRQNAQYIKEVCEKRALEGKERKESFKNLLKLVRKYPHVLAKSNDHLKDEKGDE